MLLADAVSNSRSRVCRHQDAVPTFAVVDESPSLLWQGRARIEVVLFRMRHDPTTGTLVLTGHTSSFSYDEVSVDSGAEEMIGTTYYLLMLYPAENRGR